MKPPPEPQRELRLFAADPPDADPAAMRRTLLVVSVSMLAGSSLGAFLGVVGDLVLPLTLRTAGPIIPWLVSFIPLACAWSDGAMARWKLSLAFMFVPPAGLIIGGVSGTIVQAVLGADAGPGA